MLQTDTAGLHTASILEPSSVWFNDGSGEIFGRTVSRFDRTQVGWKIRTSRLIGRRLYDLPLGIAYWLALFQDVHGLDLLRRAAMRQSAVRSSSELGRVSFSPIEVLALHLDVCHAVTRVALAGNAGFFLFSITHCRTCSNEIVLQTAVVER